MALSSSSAPWSKQYPLALLFLTYIQKQQRLPRLEGFQELARPVPCLGAEVTSL